MCKTNKLALSLSSNITKNFSQIRFLKSSGQCFSICGSRSLGKPYEHYRRGHEIFVNINYVILPVLKCTIRKKINFICVFNKCSIIYLLYKVKKKNLPYYFNNIVEKKNYKH